MKVLVIDDDDVARRAACVALNAAGYAALELKSPIGATRYIYEERVDAVVMAMDMPPLGGDVMARILRGSVRGDRLAIVLVSRRPRADVAETSDADEIVRQAEVPQTLATAVLRSIQGRREGGRGPLSGRPTSKPS